MIKDGIKTKAWKDILIESEVDIIGFAETNLNWSKLTQENSLWARTSSWFEARTVSVAHNTADRTAPRRQAGGTALVAMNEVSFRMCEHGKDPRQLGRWTWMRFNGKNGVTTRVVSVYRPCKSTTSMWSAYLQQLRGLTAEGISTCPREQFRIDLKEEITRWTTA